MLRESATWRLIGCSMKSVAAQLAADLELEAALAVRGDDLVERLGQAVVDARARRLVGSGDRIDEPDRVPRLDARHRREAGEEAIEIERTEVRDRRMRRHADEVAAHRRPEADAGQTAHRVEHAAVEHRVAVARDERRQLEAAAGAQLIAVVVGEQIERRRRLRFAIRVGRDLDRLAQLVVVLRVGQRRVLVEPLGRERLGGVAEALAAVVEADLHAHDRLATFGVGDRAETKRHAQPERLLERLDAEHLDLGRERGSGRARDGHGAILPAKGRPPRRRGTPAPRAPQRRSAAAAQPGD